MRPLLDRRPFDFKPHKFGDHLYYEELEGLAIYHTNEGLLGVIRWAQLRAALRRKDGGAAKKRR